MTDTQELEDRIDDLEATVAALEKNARAADELVAKALAALAKETGKTIEFYAEDSVPGAINTWQGGITDTYFGHKT